MQRRLGEAIQQFFHFGHPCFRVLHPITEAQLIGAGQAEAGRFGLHQRHNALRRHLGLGGEFQLAACIKSIHFGDAQALGGQLHPGHAEEMLHRFRHSPKAVHHLRLQLAQRLPAAGIGDAPVEQEAGVHIRQIVVGDERRQVQLHLRAGVQLGVQPQFLAFLQRLHGPLQQFHVEGEADAVHVAGLAVAQELPGAADFQVVGGKHEASAQVLGLGDGGQPLAGVGGHGLGVGGQQIGIGLVVGAAHPAAQLVHLGQAELVGPFHDDGVGAGDVDAGLNDGGAHQNLRALVVEVRHHLFQLPLAHLAMAYGDAGARRQFRHLGGGPLDAAHLVVQVVHLAAAQQLPLYGFLDEALVMLAHEGLDGQAPCRRRGDDAEVAQAGHGEVQGARDGGGGERQYVHLGAQGLQPFLLAHAKAVLLVDDHQAQVLELHRLLQQGMGADDDVYPAVGKPCRHLCLLGFGLEAAERFGAHWRLGKAVAEGLLMLLHQKGGGRQHRHLLAGASRQEGGAHGDLRLAEAHIAADEPVHGAAAGHVRQDALYGGLLVGCLFKREAGGKGLVGGVRRRIGEAGPRLAAGVDVQQLRRHVAQLQGCLAPCPPPGVAAQPVQGRRALAAAGVAGNQMQGGHRHIELGVVLVGDSEELGGLAVYGKALQALVAANAMLQMHHWRALAQLGKAAEGLALGGGARLPAPALLQDPLAEELLLGDKRQALIGEEPPLQGGDGEGQGLAPRDKSPPGIGMGGFEALLGQELLHHFAAACAFRGDEQAPARLGKEALQGGQGGGAARREGQLRQGAEAQALPLAGLFQEVNARVPLDAGEEAVLAQQQFLGGQEGAEPVMAELLVAVFGLLAEAVQLRLHRLHANQRALLQVVKQGFQLREEERQVAFNAGWGQPLGQVPVGWALVRVSPPAQEPFVLEVADGIAGEGELSCRQKVHGLYLLYGPLGFRVEGADAVYLVVKEVDAQRQGGAHGVEVHDGAAHRVFAMLQDRLHPPVGGAP